MDKYRIKLTLTEPLLGTVPLDRKVYETYIADSAPSPEAVEEELMTVAEALEKGTTGFHREDGRPFIYDYQLKGFFKDACSMLRRNGGTTLSSKLAAHKKVIDGMLFVKPRRVFLDLAGDIDILERPLRAQTAQGERVALARSEIVPVGSSITFDLWLLGGATEAHVREWLEYGELRGLGQWRNGGYGTFTYEMEPAS